MVIIILGVIVCVGLWILASSYILKGNSNKIARNIIKIIGVILLVACIVSGCVTTVHTGYTGIVTKFNQVQDYTYEAGLHFKSPFIKVIEMDNREQRTQFHMEAFSADIQEVQIDGSINYSIDRTTAMSLYKNVGVEYPTILIAPRAQEVVKANFSQYTAEGLIAHRQQLSSEIFTALKDDLAPQGITIISVSVENIDFTDAFTNAVEAKQVATQEKQRAQTQQEQQTMEAQQAAERKKISAEAEAEVAKIQADADAYSVQVKAEAEAAANKKINESLTNELIKYNYVHQWDGAMPTIMMGSDGSLLINPGDILD